jgi:hypothetical protein
MNPSTLHRGGTGETLHAYLENLDLSGALRVLPVLSLAVMSNSFFARAENLITEINASIIFNKTLKDIDLTGMASSLRFSLPGTDMVAYCARPGNPNIKMAPDVKLGGPGRIVHVDATEPSAPGHEGVGETGNGDVIDPEEDSDEGSDSDDESVI